MSANSNAKRLGYAGALPFIGLTLAILFGFEQFGNLIVQEMLLAYAAIILSFLGGIRWGIALSNKAATGSAYLISVLPSLIGWLAILMAPLFALTGLIVSFAILGWADLNAKYDEELSWYVTLRLQLTAIVCLCLTAIWLTLLVGAA